MADFNALRKHLLGEEKTTRLFIADLFVDELIMKQYCEKRLHKPWIRKEEDLKEYCKNKIDVYKKMGFDYVPESHWIHSWIGLPEVTSWINEHSALITNRKDFNNFPWDSIQPDLKEHKFLCELLPDNLKIVVETGSFQDVLDVLVGYESTFFLIYDDPALLIDIINRWFSFKQQFYRVMVKNPKVGAVWHADDLGSKTGPLISPVFIRETLIPWYKEYSDMIHEADKMFWFHCCGNIYNDKIIEDLIYKVGIDAFHSFQDSILPVQDFMEIYGGDVGIIGGIDVDFLSSSTPGAIKEYINKILSKAYEVGRFALGTGNSVTEYIPFENWETVLQFKRIGKA